MPLLFFDVCDNGTLERDEFGVELDSLDGARDQAVALLPEIAREGVANGEHRIITATVRCQRGHVRYRASLTIDGGWVAPAGEATPRVVKAVDGSGSVGQPRSVMTTKA